jgi:hypothetical protein
MADVKQLIIELSLENKQLKAEMNAMNKKFTQFNTTSKKSVGMISRVKAGYLAVGAVIGGVVVKGLTSLIKKASDAQETFGKFDTVFKNVKGQADSAAKALADSFGLSSVKAKELLGDTGDLLSGFGFTGQEALKLSDEVNRLAVDLASFTNFSGGAEGASKILTKALLGERESMKSLGIAITEADIKQLAEDKGIVGELDRQQKAMLTLELATRQSKNAIGDFERTQTGFANQSRILKARLEDISVAIGSKLLPGATDFMNFLNDAFDINLDLTTSTEDVTRAYDDYKVALDKASKSTEELTDDQKALNEVQVTTARAKLFKEIDDLNRSFAKQEKEIAKLEKKTKEYNEAVKESEIAIANAKAQGEDQVKVTFENGLFIKELNTRTLDLAKAENVVANTRLKAIQADSELKTKRAELNQETLEAADLSTKMKDVNLLELIGNEDLRKSIAAKAQDIKDGTLVVRDNAEEEAALRRQEREERQADILEKRQQKEEDRLQAQIDKEERINTINEIRSLQKQALEEELIDTMDTKAELKALSDKELADKLESIQKLTDAEKNKSSFLKKLRSEEVQATRTALSDISGLTASENKTLFAIGKAAGIANATISTAEAVAKTFASVPYPLNIPLGIAQGAAGAVQIGKIAATKFEPPKKASGGIIDRVAPANISGEDGIIAAQLGESVLTREATAVLGKDAIDALNAGQSIAPNVTITVVSDNGDEVVDTLNEYFREFGTSRMGLNV